MRNIIYNLPEQIKDAWKIPVKITKSRKHYSNIVISGMGGSGIGGDILQSLLLSKTKIPIVTIKDYHIPDFVGKDTLFIAVSYSGNTEETINGFFEAQRKGAHIVAITSGGTLWDLCQKYQIDCVEIPAGLSSRCAIGYLFFPQLKILTTLKLSDDFKKELTETIEILATRRNYYERIAAQLGKELKNFFPLIYATSPLLKPVAVRWQTQFNENAEIIAHSNVFPELNHNEIMGLLGPSPLVPIYCLILLDPETHPRNLLRVKYTLELLRKGFSERNSVKSTFFRYRKFSVAGKSKLARIFSFIMLGDFISFYLARERGVTPEIIRAIEELKKKMANNKQ
jgi:glucose/mannose-6-phosphate isomerase